MYREFDDNGEMVYLAKYLPKYNKKNLVQMLDLGYRPSLNWSSYAVTIRKRYSSLAEAEHHVKRAVANEKDALVTTDAAERERRNSKEARRIAAKKTPNVNYDPVCSTRGGRGKSSGGRRGRRRGGSTQKRKKDLPDTSDEPTDEDSDSSIFLPISPIIGKNFCILKDV